MNLFAQSLILNQKSTLPLRDSAGLASLGVTGFPHVERAHDVRVDGPCYTIIRV
ncbi:MAG: hypothetical protein OES12_13745 [Anaerolineae bacterium]|nr:hypothetical protein [Anaerolineae bacterium]